MPCFQGVRVVNRKDYTGLKFGKLTFLESTKERSGTNVVWKLQCDCGSIIFRPATDIVKGTKSCGCLFNRAGQKFGMLTFIEPTDKNQRGNIIWKLQCDCGQFTFLPANHVVGGNTKSCGCLTKHDWSGQKFGMLTFLEPTKERKGKGIGRGSKGKHIVWKLQCDCGNVIFLDGISVRSGNTKSCGCLKLKVLKERAIYKTPEQKRKRRKELQRKRYARSPFRKSVSSAIRSMLKENDAIKPASCLKYLPYTMQELREHLEILFEPWMNWSNYGAYKRLEWKDDDPSTWRWSLDHIIPQSTLPYKSMKSKNFKKCWALENLRPLSAKQNMLDGNRRPQS